MKKKKIVTIGGGTGSFMLLSGLKKYPVDISAVVSMADDGGSTGVLRDELGVLPPGDVRQCLVALSESSGKMRELMNYRFEEGGLKGHSFGNLLLSALEKVNGSFSAGVEEAMDILKVCGEVIPVTNQDAKLEMLLKDGSILHGEDQINRHTYFQEVGVDTLCFTAVSSIKAHPKALKRIAAADMIVIGPGNLYCSLLPSLIIKECAKAIRTSGARVVLVGNLTNKRGHTSGWDVDDYVSAVESYVGKGRIDYVIHNAKRPRAELVKKYEAMEGDRMLVEWKRNRNPKRRYRLVLADVVSGALPRIQAGDTIASTRAFIRHDSDKLARTIMFLLDSESNRSIIRDIV